VKSRSMLVEEFENRPSLEGPGIALRETTTNTPPIIAIKMPFSHTELRIGEDHE